MVIITSTVGFNLDLPVFVGDILNFRCAALILIGQLFFRFTGTVTAQDYLAIRFPLNLRSTPAVLANPSITSPSTRAL